VSLRRISSKLTAKHDKSSLQNLQPFTGGELVCTGNATAVCCALNPNPSALSYLWVTVQVCQKAWQDQLGGFPGGWPGLPPLPAGCPVSL